MSHLAKAWRGQVRAFILFVGLLLSAAIPASAQAAFVADLTTAAPANAEASAYSDFTLNLDFPRDSSPRNLNVDLPRGQLAVLNAATICSTAQYQADACPDSSRIGSVSVVAGTTIIGNITAPGSIYRLGSAGTEIGRVGVIARPPIGDKMQLQGLLRLRDDQSYGIRVSVQDIPRVATLSVPLLGAIPLDVTVESMRMVLFGRVGGTGPLGFFFNPADCVPATTVVSATAWDGSTASSSRSYTPTNCGAVPFQPSLAFSPSPAPAATPTPFSTRLSMAFDPTAAKIGSPIRAARLVLPEGVQLSGAANSSGTLTDCSDAQFGQTTLLPASCPAGSKVGTVILDSPLLGPIPGDAFLAQPASGPNDLARLFVVAQLGPQSDALRVKLMARVQVDPQTGLLSALLDDLPAQPVNSLTLTFAAGDSPTIRQSRTCGTSQGSIQLTPYASPTPVQRTSSYVVAGNCPTPGRFRPAVSMSLSPARAGATTTGTTAIALPIGDEPLRTVTASLPPGLLAKLAGVPRCTLTQTRSGTCPAATQVGRVQALSGQGSKPGAFAGTISLTDAPNPQSVAGLFVKVPVLVGPIRVGEITTLASLKLRPDYGVDVVSPVPTDLRGVQLDMQQLALVLDRPDFLIAPPTCNGVEINGSLESLQGTSAQTSSPIAVTGCDRLGFDPVVRFSTTGAPGAASAFTTTVELPASTDAAAQSPVSRISMRLPEGVSLSASAGATGDLAGCTTEQFDAAELTAPSCPAGSAVGSITIDTPSIGRLDGTAYLGTPTDGHLARLFLDATSEDLGPGVRVKIAGDVDVDPATGRTTATFDGLPPVGFTRFSLTTRGGANPVLALPRTCGSFAGGASITPTTGARVEREASLELRANCPDPAAFSPQIAVTTSGTQAGADTAMTATVTADSTGPELRTLDLTMPAGLLGRLTAATQCPLDDARADRCGASSLVGSVEAQAGVRGAPFAVPGKIYLTAGAGDAIAGLAFSLPAKVGPIDLGTVVTLAELRLTPGDLRLRVTAAEIPTQVKGVRLDLQRLAITIDKAGLVVNPTSCAAAQGTAQFGGLQGASASASFSYEATGCGSLRWQPTLQVAFSGAASDLSVKGHPTITTVIEMPRGQGNLRTADVVLPDGAATDLASVNARVCASAAAAAAGSCPAASQIGTGEIRTSALPRPVTAAILLVKVPGQVLPGIALRIRDQISFDLLGITRVTSQGRVRVSFENAPDAPIEQLSLTFVGGTGGVIQLGKEICGVADAGTDATLTAHTGAASTLRVPVTCAGRGRGQAAQTKGTASAMLTVRLSGRKRGATLVVRASAGARTITLRMPSGLGFARGKAATKTLTIKAAGGKRIRARTTLRGTLLTVKLSTRGLKRVQIVVPPAATRFRAPSVRALRSAAGRKRAAARISVVDAAGATHTPKLNLKLLR